MFSACVLLAVGVLVALAMVLVVLEECTPTQAVLLVTQMVWFYAALRGWNPQSAPLVKDTPRTTANVGVQCDIGSAGSTGEHVRPGSRIYVAPSSVRWHSSFACKHMKACTRVSTLTPCQTCCPAESGY